MHFSYQNYDLGKSYYYFFLFTTVNVPIVAIEATNSITLVVILSPVFGLAILFCSVVIALLAIA